MSITLTHDTESRLREHAARMGQDADTVADVLLANALADQQAESSEALTEDQLTQIRTGIRRDNTPAPSLTPAEAADLRARLRSFAEDWDRPDMDVYDAL